MEKAEDMNYPEQGGEQNVGMQVEGLLRWDPRRKQVSTGPQRQHQSWNLVGGGRIYLNFLELDKVHGIEVSGREQRHPHVQKQTSPPTKQAEAGEAEKAAHGEVEIQQTQQQRSPTCEENMMEATQGFQGTLQDGERSTINSLGDREASIILRNHHQTQENQG